MRKVNNRWSEKIFIEENQVPQYEIIKRDANPIFIWGCGGVAMSVYEYCQKFDIKVAGCFVNVSVKEQLFTDLIIYQLNELIEKKNRFSVIIGHANYEKGINELKEIENIQNIYCLSSVCANHTELIPKDFISMNYSVLNYVYNDLQDEASKECLITYFESRINDKAEYMFGRYKQDMGYFINDIIELTEQETLLDIGAYTGTTLLSFLRAVQGKYRSIVALEPDEDNYIELNKNIKKSGYDNIFTKQVCAYNEDKNVRFGGCKEIGGIKKGEFTTDSRLYPARRIDTLCREFDAINDTTILKINFAFSVIEVLDGAQGLIKSKKPRIIIRAGFDEKVLLKAYLAIKNLNSEYKMWLRYTVGIPQGLTIFAS